MKKLLFLTIFLSFTVAAIFPHASLSLFRKNGKYGIINQNREIILPAEYSEISINENVIAKGDSITKVLNKNGEQLYQYPKILTVTNVSESFIQVTKKLSAIEELELLMNGKSSTGNNFLLNINTGDKYFVDGQFRSGNEDAAAWFAGKYSYFSKADDFSTKTEVLYSVYPFRNGRAVIWDGDKKLKIIDEDFNVILSDIHACDEVFSEGLLPVVMEDGTSGFVDENGKFVINCSLFVDYRINGNQEDSPFVHAEFSDGMAVIQTSQNKWKIIDKTGKYYEFPEKYHLEAEHFCNHRLLVSTTVDGYKKYGFLDEDCNLVIPFEYSYAEDFVNDYAIVIFDGKDCIVDKNGKVYDANESCERQRTKFDIAVN